MVWFIWFDYYSESKDLEFCLPCFLFKNVSKYGGYNFVGDGFGDWKNAQRMDNHATSSHSHVDYMHMGYDLMNSNQSIKVTLVNQTKKMNVEYRFRVNTSLIATKFLLRCDMPFRDVWCDPKFVKLKGLSDLYTKLVEINKCNIFDMVYKLLKLALVLQRETCFFSYKVCEESAM